ncbi:MAG TPA: nucleotide exchange factor GrpE [Thermomicrobiaceae bacterium]|nr:nucleotide exchange factor GrpE [Thermomicrobiaceae bacterium]
MDEDRRESAPEQSAPEETTETDGVVGERLAEPPAASEAAAQLDAERARAEEYLEQARRARAELINYRRRMEQETEQVRRNAGERIIARLLPVADDFARALGAVPESEMQNPWIQGILLIERKLWSILEAEGVQPIEAVGQPFNPALHEAVSMDSGGGNQVVAEYQRGYTLHDRVLRPAMVRVGAGKQNGQEANSAQNGEPAS